MSRSTKGMAYCPRCGDHIWYEADNEGKTEKCSTCGYPVFLHERFSRANRESGLLAGKLKIVCWFEFIAVFFWILVGIIAEDEYLSASAVAGIGFITFLFVCFYICPIAKRGLNYEIGRLSGEMDEIASGADRERRMAKYREERKRYCEEMDLMDEMDEAKNRLVEMKERKDEERLMERIYGGKR